MKQLFLTFAAALLLLPATLWADTAKKKIKSVEITIDAPTPGMDLEKAEKLAQGGLSVAGRCRCLTNDSNTSIEKEGYIPYSLQA